MGSAGRGKGRQTHGKKLCVADFESIVLQAVEVLKSRAPRRHSKFRKSRDDLKALAEVCHEGVALDIINQLLQKLEQ